MRLDTRAPTEASARRILAGYFMEPLQFLPCQWPDCETLGFAAWTGETSSGWAQIASGDLAICRQAENDLEAVVLNKHYHEMHERLHKATARIELAE
jgi:hypothetical protein